MSDDELRQRMYEAANELLDGSGGLHLSLEHLNLEAVMRRADVSRSAVYRVWPAKDDFNLDFLGVLAAPNWMGAAALDQATPELAAAILYQDPQLLKTAEGRRQALLEAVRQAAQQNFEAIISRPAWRVFVVLTLTLPSLPEGARREHIRALLRESDRHFASRMADFYRAQFPALGLRPKAPFTLANVHEILARVGGALVQGLGLHYGLDPALSELRIQGPGGEWSAAAFGFLAIVDALVEADPDFIPNSAPDAG